TTRIGQLPADRKPRQVAQHIRQMIHTFLKQQADTFQKLRGYPLDFASVHTRCWEWYGKKDYAHRTEKLETVKLKLRVYLDFLARQLTNEALTHQSDHAAKPPDAGQ